jgi:hypothetical protein
MSQTHESPAVAGNKTKREVSIKWRDVRIAYEVDEKSIAELAELYDIDWADMKKVLMEYGISVRRDSETRPEPAKPYTIHLVDTDKVIKAAAKPVNAAV